MWRQGDVLIEKVDRIPQSARPIHHPVLAVGASTGQRHRIRDAKSARLYWYPVGRNRQLYLDVTAPTAEVIHPEHASIVLVQGIYRVWQQREYGDAGPRTVID
jgi:hypothetical protein